MGKPTGFKEYERTLPTRRPVPERLRDWREIYTPFPENVTRQQGARCMDCGIPTCHSGCPLGNLIPDWNDLVYQGRWKAALDRLHATNNFPEFTGRLCPAPCEAACVLNINDDPVTIEEIEKQIVEHGFAKGWVVPQPPSRRTGKRVAVIGSGPAGLAAAQQLNRVGHDVTVLERDKQIGGLLRYGIPDFKLEKHIIDRRLAVLAEEGISFAPGIEVGGNWPVANLQEFDAVLLTTGAMVPRDLAIPGRELDGVHFAMDYLTQQNRRVADSYATNNGAIDAAGKDVIVIGGGDTGSDCIGTANRQGAASVTNLELLPKPPLTPGAESPWPWWPLQLRTSSSHEEGSRREWAVLTKRFIGEGSLRAIETIEVEFDSGRMRERPGTEHELPAGLVLLALGFTGPSQSLPKQLGVTFDDRGNIDTDRYATAAPGVFAAGDANRGQSLIVWAISEGREAARQVDAYLGNKRSSPLPSKGHGDLKPRQ